MTLNSDPKRDLLRHTLATLAYRGGKTLRNARAEFAEFHACASSRTPVQILAHIGDLLDWAVSIAQGKETWKNSNPLTWEKEIDRFFATLKSFDDYLASAEPLHVRAEKLFQGPIADALKPGNPQLRMLRSWNQTVQPLLKWKGVQVVLGTDDEIVGNKYTDLVDFAGGGEGGWAAGYCEFEFGGDLAAATRIESFGHIRNNDYTTATYASQSKDQESRTTIL